MISFHYTCKFCRKPGFVHGDEEGLKLIRTFKWLPSLCCDRCGRYMIAKRKVNIALAKCCRLLEVCRERPGKRQEAEAAVYQSLIVLTKKLTQIVCYYYRVTNIWEEDFAKMIFEQPSKLSAIIAAYIRGVALEARKTHEYPRETTEASAEHRTEAPGPAETVPAGAQCSGPAPETPVPVQREITL